MYDTLCTTIMPKKSKKDPKPQPSSTVSNPNQNQAPLQNAGVVT